MMAAAVEKVGRVSPIDDFRAYSIFPSIAL
jgi:hypothetical protein